MSLESLRKEKGDKEINPKQRGDDANDQISKRHGKTSQGPNRACTPKKLRAFAKARTGHFCMEGLQMRRYTWKRPGDHVSAIITGALVKKL
jgi:hypothetical protein